MHARKSERCVFPLRRLVYGVSVRETHFSFSLFLHLFAGTENASFLRRCISPLSARPSPALLGVARSHVATDPLSRTLTAAHVGSFARVLGASHAVTSPDCRGPTLSVRPTVRLTTRAACHSPKFRACDFFFFHRENNDNERRRIAPLDVTGRSDPRLSCHRKLSIRRVEDLEGCANKRTRTSLYVSARWNEIN